jgi:uncharacterized membrane protein
MAKKKTKRGKKGKVKLQSDSKLWAFLAVFLSIIGFVLALLAKKDDKYVMFYAKQSFVLFISGLIVSAIAWVPLIGWVAFPILSLILFVLSIIALVYSLSGEMKETPIVGEYGNKLDI